MIDPGSGPGIEPGIHAGWFGWPGVDAEGAGVLRKGKAPAVDVAVNIARKRTFEKRDLAKVRSKGLWMMASISRSASLILAVRRRVFSLSSRKKPPHSFRCFNGISALINRGGKVYYLPPLYPSLEIVPCETLC
jgi:hypothetical protein